MTDKQTNQSIIWWGIIVLLVIVFSLLHYTTSTMKWQYHLVYMQAYFIPILIAALQFGVRGGLGTAIAVSLVYLPHVMFQWGGLVETNLMRFLQIGLYNIIGYLVGLKAGAEKKEKDRYQKIAEELQISLNKLEEQSDKLSELEQQLRLADRLSVVGELTASLAHEVRNPLGAIRGASEILKDELPENIKSSEFFQIILQEINRLNEVLENYLSFARIKSDEKFSFDLIEIINNIAQMLGYSARKSGIQLNNQIPGESISIQGSPNHFRQILTNVLLNSIQAMPNGGNIAVIVSSKKETVELKVVDNGPGIKVTDLERIFRPFYTTKKGGTGLGLAIVKRLADENDWQLRVESQLERGTKFTLIFKKATRGINENPFNR